MAKTAHLYLKELEKFLDFNIEEKIHFIVYNSQGKFRQSNVGLTNDITSNIGGTIYPRKKNPKPGTLDCAYDTGENLLISVVLDMKNIPSQ